VDKEGPSIPTHGHGEPGTFQREARRWGTSAATCARGPGLCVPPAPYVSLPPSGSPSPGQAGALWNRALPRGARSATASMCRGAGYGDPRPADRSRARGAGWTGQGGPAGAGRGAGVAATALRPPALPQCPGPATRQAARQASIHPRFWRSESKRRRVRPHRL
jgi:hypothetical protein